MIKGKKQSEISSMSDEQFFNKEFLVDEGRINSDDFPELYNLSSGFFFQFQTIPNEVMQPEYVYISQALSSNKSWVELDVFISQWNICWESAQLRHDLFYDSLPGELSWIRNYEGHNIYLIPRRKQNNLYAYMPIYHMLPQSGSNP